MSQIETRRFRRYESLQCVSFQSPGTDSNDDASNEDETPKMTIPVTLGREVFWGCRSLTHVKFPSNMALTEIPGHAFSYCFALHTFELPGSSQSSLKVIGECAFLFCEALTELVMPDSIVEIKRQAFFECRKLRLVTMPNRLEMIGKEAFAYCSELQHMTLSSSVHSLGINVFHNCRSMRFLDLDGTYGTNDRHKLALAIQLCVLYPKETQLKISMDKLVHQYARHKIKPSELLTRTPSETKKLKEIQRAYIESIRELVLWTICEAGLIR
ncbi:unnamed protein product [Cylindrotheca closterium]|uniref:Uncharacterized protein n=1 Tax=Cylindrotheca closterium TaxID=2856 RepID=A0AAD2G1J1_9STRA|nr:unnamed protein product [Cylindrotheca closterium]